MPADGMQQAESSSSGQGRDDLRRQQEPVDRSELPFLVTHWLRNFNLDNDQGVDRNETMQIGNSNKKKREELERIQKAASDLASAFAALGAFGTSTVPLLSTNTENQKAPAVESTIRNATFADLNRQWASIPPNHLSNLLSAAVSSTLAAEEAVDYRAESNLVHAASEAIHHQRRNPSSGRTVQDAIDLDNEEKKEQSIVPIKPSLLQRPAKLEFDLNNQQHCANPAKVPSPPPLESDIKQWQVKSSQAMRQYLDLKDKLKSHGMEMASLQESLNKQQHTKNELQQKRLGNGASLKPEAMEVCEEEQNADRVIAQLERKLVELMPNEEKIAQELRQTKQQAFSLYETTKKSFLGYRDPFNDATRLRPNLGLEVARNNGILRSWESRRVGLSNQLARTRGLIGMGSATNHANRVRKAVAVSRYSHAVTINAHLTYPVFCLRFDQTGRYFVTGSDDKLVKVFCLGPKQAVDSTGKGRLGQGQELTIRGAVLVCTLRGHVGVINEIDISSDNCFIATASDDGDCRVWGLKDGAPVAILRGHGGGCNMVSWSKLTPYRLVTAGTDGFARNWDIREAALKRYGAIVGKRPEYSLQLTEEEKKAASREQTVETSDNRDPAETQADVVAAPLSERQVQEGNNNDVPALPDQAPLQPLPQPENNEDIASAAAAAAAAAALPDQAPLQPLPLPVAGHVPGAQPANQEQANDIVIDAQDGLFVANDEIDEGVKLVAKFQHGSPREEQVVGPGTRSRRAVVTVVCIARCPIGGHFATGSSDGICRIFEDLDDADVETVDRRFCQAAFEWMEGNVKTRDNSKRRSLRGADDSDHLLLQLKGHLTTITDLKYSNAGDRIMTGSQNDGVVRIWSWDADPIIPDSNLPNKDRGLRHIVIKLINPMLSGSVYSRKASRRRAPTNRSSQSGESKIELNVAAWTNDDTKIITSQAQKHRHKANDYEPDSHFFFLWDSVTGHCLMGIAGGHAGACDVVLNHPTDANIFLSGGHDGFCKVWDCETGKCLFSHKNVIEYSPMDAADIAKQLSGQFLDGAFFPDGSGFLLTDMSGRVCVFDSYLSSSEQQSNSHSPPYWLKEQYFSNDYYDLFYDANGYCVEQGSRMPPHLAPRGARCSPTGAPYPENVDDAFKKLIGPLPLPVRDSQWCRESIRCRSRVIRANTKALRGSVKSRRGNIMQEYDPLTTILVRGSTGEVITTRNAQGEIVFPSPVTTASSPTRSPNRTAHAEEPRRSAYSGRQLSSNYRWRDYNDMLQEERHYDEDEDDEEFQPAPRNPRNRTSARQGADSDDESDDDDLEAFERQHQHQSTSRQASSSRQASRQTSATRNMGSPVAASPQETRPARSSNRRRASTKGRYSDGSDEDDEFVEEVLSTNNDPAGPFAEDYNTHAFRVPSNGPHIARQWLQRIESDSGYQGRKIYCPQVGDTVVYIPRAHFETIQAFPSLKAPWQHWPAEAEWPVARCRIRDIRYRFPYIDYYGGRKSSSNKCNSVVAIVTLEVTGIPVLSQERDFLWPDATFIPPAKSHIFELGVFENSGQEEFLVPYDRYIYRLQCLEEAIRRTNNTESTPEIAVYFDDDHDQKRNEDAELVYYLGKLDDFCIRDGRHNDENLNNCGYGAVRIVWNDSTSHELSPWEVIVEKPKSSRYSLTRGSLDDNEKRRAREALKKIRRMAEVRDFFNEPVNERRYIDYSLRVEVPMNLKLIERRLDANYYSTRFSIVADVKLIRDNCVKYNGEVGDLQDVARKMFADFEREMLSEEERNIYHDLNTTVTTVNEGESTSGSRSSLENLPPPVSQTSDTNRRRSLRIRLDASQIPARASSGRATRANPGPDEPEPEPSAHAVAFANASRGLTLGRQSRGELAPELTTRRQRQRSASMAAAAPPAAPPRRSTRPREAPSSLLEELTAETQASPARRTRSHDAPLPAPEDSAEDSSESESESDTKPPARAMRNSTQSRNDDDPDSEYGSESESETEHKSSHRPPRRASRRGTKEESEEDSVHSSDETSPRLARKRKAHDDSSVSGEFVENHGHSSDEGGESEEDDQSESDFVASHPGKRKAVGLPNRSSRASASNRTSRARSQPESTIHGTRRSARSNSISYVEKSESEFDDSPSEDESSEDERNLRGSARKRAAPKRKPARSLSRSPRGAANKRARTRKKKADDTSDEEDEENEDYTDMKKRARPTRQSRARKPQSWHEIDKKDITKVAKGVLDFLRAIDETNLFENPVLEDYPGIRTEYSEVCPNPMDFRTIEEDRLPCYESILELQEDLILVFQNCIKFNGPTSDNGKVAKNMLDMLPDAFENAVGDLDG